MGEEHLAKLLIQYLLSVPDLYADVAQGQALQILTDCFLCLKGHQGRGKLGNGMSQLRRETVSVAGRARRRIGQSAGGHDHGIGRDHLLSAF